MWGAAYIAPCFFKVTTLWTFLKFIVGNFWLYHRVQNTLKCISLNFSEKNRKSKKVMIFLSWELCFLVKNAKYTLFLNINKKYLWNLEWKGVWLCERDLVEPEFPQTLTFLTLIIFGVGGTKKGVRECYIRTWVF